MTDNTDLIAQLTRRADEMEAIADTAGLRSSWYLEGAAALRKAARDNRRAVKALTAVAPGVRVKALKWEEEYGYAGRTETGIGVYCIEFFPGQGQPYKLHNVFDEKSYHPTLEAAKAAAQADYEARILAALDTPAPAMGELVEALRGLMQPGMSGAQQLAAHHAARAVLAKIGGQ
jgi:hypothetical protein